MSAALRVYLAGGMESGWQDEVTASIPEHAYLDPRSHGLTDVTRYTAWDLAAIRESDLVFAYFEPSNPYGYNLAFEVGYAVALGKSVIFVDEKYGDNDRPCSMLREVSQYARTLGAGIAMLANR